MGSYSALFDTHYKNTTVGYILKTDKFNRNIHTKDYKLIAWWLRKNLTDGDDDWWYDHPKGTAAHWGVHRSWEFFRTKYNMNGPSFASSQVRVFSDRYDLKNASSLHVNNLDYISFGIANNGDYLLTLDIAGHEYTHAIISWTADLDLYKEPGALAESICDIFGVGIEKQTRGGSGWNWTILEDIANYSLSRDLSDPKSSDTPQPDTYNGTYFNPNGSIHTTGGLSNKWFYNLANGASGTNDLGSSYVVSGIGMDKAHKILYYALISSFTSHTDFHMARAHTIAAAKAIYGECSSEYISVIDAWYSVGVGLPNTCGETNIKEANLSDIDISIFPNPTQETLNLSLLESSKFNVKIYDFSGKLLISKSVFGPTSSINLNKLSSGLYNLVISNNQSLRSFRFVKK